MDSPRSSAKCARKNARNTRQMIVGIESGMRLHCTGRQGTQSTSAVAKNDFFTPEKSVGFFGGGNEMYNQEGKKLLTLNITMDESTGIGSWTEEQFIKAVKTGIIPTGGLALRFPMQPYSNLSDQEVKAIYAYLKTVPKLNHKVDRALD